MKSIVRIALVVSIVLTYIPFSVRPTHAAAVCDSFDPGEPGSFYNPVDPKTLKSKFVEVLFYIGAPGGSGRNQKVQVKVDGACLWTQVRINVEFHPAVLKNGLTYWDILEGDQLEYDLTFDQYTGRVSGIAGIWTVSSDSYFADIYEVADPTAKDTEIQMYWWPRFQRAVAEADALAYESSPFTHCETILEYFWMTQWAEQIYKYLSNLCAGRIPSPNSLRYLENMTGAGAFGLFSLLKDDGWGIEALTIETMPKNGHLAGYLTPCQLPKYLFLGYEVLVTRPVDTDQATPGSLIVNFFTIGTGIVYSYPVWPGQMITVFPQYWDTSVKWDNDSDFTSILPVSRMPIFRITDCS